MPKRHFLKKKDPLAKQVAEWIVKRDAKDSLLITPTSGASREIDRYLIGHGAKSLPSERPMQAILPDDHNVASPMERSLAWAQAIKQIKKSDLQALFWKKNLRSTKELLKAGRQFNTLCDQLAETGLDPTNLILNKFRHIKIDKNRWTAIDRLYKQYLKLLKKWQLCDPNVLRLENIYSPRSDIQNLIIASVPDLPRAFEFYADTLESSGVRVDVLIWDPLGSNSDHFDIWGRPLIEFWNTRPININEEQIHVASSASEETYICAKIIVDTQVAVVVADQNINKLLAGEITSQGARTYLPEGRPLHSCEAAKFVLGWEEFRQSKDLRQLRRLLELPAFCRILGNERLQLQADALCAIDHLLNETIAETLEAAWLASPALPKEADSKERKIRSKIRSLLGYVQSRLHYSALELIEIAFSEGHAEFTEASQRITAIGHNLEDSPMMNNWIKNGSLSAEIWAEAIKSERLQKPPPRNAIILNGWLEAPWQSDKQMILCGLVDGSLPQSIDSSCFLPNSTRTDLGLNNNAHRQARDAYLLSALLARYPKDNLHLSYSKYNTIGDPNKPSRLLLSTQLDELPRRIEYIMKSHSKRYTQVPRQTKWRWQLPCEIPVVTAISPTEFESYLACPFRFFLEKVIRGESTGKPSREMDASVFGNIIHEVLENFGREVIPKGKSMLELSEQRIGKSVQKYLEHAAVKKFGTKASPTIQVQLASASARLQAFAREQAACFDAGWIILDVERKLKVNDYKPLILGGLRLSGIIDRVDQNIQTGDLRVLDYKTFSSVKKPAEAHFAPQSHNWLKAAKVEVQTKSKNATRTWKNLQLPLYRKILEHWYPDICKTNESKIGYFILPSDPNECGIYEFNELDDQLYKSAIDCAEVVAKEVSKSVFWPPQPFRGSWEDPAGTLFVNGSPENCISADTIKRLMGTKK